MINMSETAKRIIKSVDCPYNVYELNTSYEKISRLCEYQSKAEHYYPYEQ